MRYLIVTLILSVISGLFSKSSFAASYTPTPPITSPVPPNFPPTIDTGSLKKAFLNQTYQVDIQASDKNVHDSLSLTLTGLPANLKVASCTRSVRFFKAYVTCQITGIPTKLGTFDIKASVSDGITSTTKNLKLTVSRPVIISGLYQSLLHFLNLA